MFYPIMANNLALAVGLGYAAIHEYRIGNTRDAKLLGFASSVAIIVTIFTLTHYG